MNNSLSLVQVWDKEHDDVIMPILCDALEEEGWPFVWKSVDPNRLDFKLFIQGCENSGNFIGYVYELYDNQKELYKWGVWKVYCSRPIENGEGRTTSLEEAKVKTEQTFKDMLRGLIR